MKKLFTKEVVIALSVIVSVAILVTGINYLKGVNILKPTNYYNIQYHNVTGLTVSTPVLIDGFKVGLVREIVYDYEKPGNINVEIDLDKKLKIPEGSKAIIEVDMLGTASIVLKLNKYVSEYHKVGDYLEGEVNQGLMGKLQNDIIPQAANLLPKLDSILVCVQAIVSNPALGSAITRLDRMTAELESSSIQLSRMMKKDIPVILGNVSEISSNVNTLTGDLQELPLKSTMNSVNETAENLKFITGQLRATDNTVGLLINDRSLYDRLNSTVGNADSLLVDLRLHPKRYVHFSVFGRK